MASVTPFSDNISNMNTSAISRPDERMLALWAPEYAALDSPVSAIMHPRVSGAPCSAFDVQDQRRLRRADQDQNDDGNHGTCHLLPLPNFGRRVGHLPHLPQGPRQRTWKATRGMTENFRIFGKSINLHCWRHQLSLSLIGLRNRAVDRNSHKDNAQERSTGLACLLQFSQVSESRSTT